MKVQVTHEPYTRRPVRFLELWEWQGWRMKVYGISAFSEFPPRHRIDEVKNIAKQRLPQPAITDTHYGVGYIIVHEGLIGDFGFVNWWWSQDIVQHHIYGAKKGEPLAYRYPEGAGFCVWELAVCWFEREAWVREVLMKPQPTDFAGYLAARMHADV